MKFIYSEKYEADFGPHVFATKKYRLVKERLLKENLASENDFIAPEPAPEQDLKLVHTQQYLNDMLTLHWTQRTVRSELPLTQEIIDAYRRHAQGTILACDFAIKQGIAVHLGGGFHHAFADHGEGFCYINDIAIGIKKMQALKLVQRAAVIDCDLHQGNGTAKIFQDDKSVYTFSMHQEHLYPIKEESNWDIGLNDGVGDDAYLKLLSAAVIKILPEHKPQLVVYLAGADPFQLDQLGQLKLTKPGLKKRDQIVIQACCENKIPVAITLAGGYAYDVKDTAEIHFNTCLVSLDYAKK
jgi:acetoin utilization deacetylase AcuC-like enzyme